jgi:hypothetical protein
MTAADLTAYGATFAAEQSPCLLTLTGWDDPDRRGDVLDYFADPAVTAISVVARLNHGSRCIRP